MVSCLERGADLHMAQLIPLTLTISCFSKIQIGFTFLVPADPCSPGKRAVKWVCVYTGHYGHWQTHSPSRLVWSEGWRPPGPQCPKPKPPPSPKKISASRRRRKKNSASRKPSINQSRFFYSGLSNLNHCEVHYSARRKDCCSRNVFK